LAYAKYLSPEFHMWCNTVVRDRMEGRLVATEELDITEDGLRHLGGMQKAIVAKLLKQLVPPALAEMKASMLADLRPRGDRRHRPSRGPAKGLSLDAGTRCGRRDIGCRRHHRGMDRLGGRSSDRWQVVDCHTLLLECGHPGWWGGGRRKLEPRSYAEQEFGWSSLINSHLDRLGYLSRTTAISSPSASAALEACRGKTLRFGDHVF
jgi:hypothetical protein